MIAEKLDTPNPGTSPSVDGNAKIDGGPKAEAKREQSTILFPYADLEAAIKVARSVHEIGGQSCEAEQLAATLRVAPTGGQFRALMSPGRIFGLIDYDKGFVSLTPLGLKMVDSIQEASARVEAFLQVPLYAKIYEKYKGYTLPGAQAMERQMVAFGVAQKQKDKARQVFDRSAKQSGFFWAGSDRLVKPRTANQAIPSSKTENSDHEELGPPPILEQNSVRSSIPNRNAGAQYHPFIEGLLSTLPADGTVWSVEGRAAWLEAAASVFKLLYQGDGRIKIAAEPEHSQ